jgi:hypothetical protein
MRRTRRPVEALARATAAATALVLTLLAQPAAATPTDTAPSDLGAEVVLRALSLLGIKYRFGGNTPESGLDCSGLVRLVFQDTLGAALPRRSEDISRVGGTIGPGELQPGDLVFFNTLRRAFSHVGIYIGNNQFVHAPSTGGVIRVERLDGSYWVSRFDGARRLLTPDASILATAPQPVPPGMDALLAGLGATAAGATVTRAPATGTTLSSATRASPAKARQVATAARPSAPTARARARSPAPGADRSVRLVRLGDIYTH